MHVFAHELKTYRTSTIIWSVSLSLLVVMFLSLFPALHSDIKSSVKILENLPLPVRQALGISLSDFFTIFGFYSYQFTFITLAGGIQAMNLGLGLVSKEFSGKTADFLLTKPVSRNSVLRQKIFAGLSLLLITNLIFNTVALVAAAKFSPDSFNHATFLLLNITLFLTQLVLFVIGVFLAVIRPRLKSAIAVSLPVTFAFFIIGSLGAIIGNTAIRYITPFKFYDPSYITHHQNYEWQYVAVEAVVITVLLILSFSIFNRKEVPSV